MKLYIIRHGQTDWNLEQRLQGAKDIPLNENGEHVAKMTCEGMKEIPIDLAFSSPLSRAFHTAELVCEGRNIPVIAEPRIREISFGDYEGYSHSKETYNIPDPKFINFFIKAESYRVPPNGESLESLILRTGEFLKELQDREDLQDKNILISTHGAALRGLLCNIKKNTIKNFWEGPVQKNCGVTCVEYKNGEYTILWENRTFYS